MNARDRKNHVDDTLDNLLLITSELREEFNQLSLTSEQRIEELQKENQVLKKTLNEILDVSLRLRNHTPYSGQEIAIGNSAGGFVLQIADEPMVRSFPPDPSASSSSTPSAASVSRKAEQEPSSSQGSTSTSTSTSLASSSTTPLQSSYDFHHEHHQLGHPQTEDDFILIEQQTSLPSQQAKKGRWDGMSMSWFGSGSPGSSSSSSTA